MVCALSTEKYWERLLKGQRAEFARLSQLTQQPDPKSSAEIMRRRTDFGGQIGEPARFRDRQPEHFSTRTARLELSTPSLVREKRH